ncbi:cytoskeletal protein binding protein [Coemansia sp. IMI 209127]|nr:cytoskeletal protein binding protein [Coemansia sp. IMI 209127]
MVTLGVGNTMFVVDSRNDAIPPKRFAMSDVTKCTAKKTVLGVEIGGYTPAAFDFTCSSNAEAESIMDAVNAARRGIFVGKNSMDIAEAPTPPHLPSVNIVVEPQRDRTTSIASSVNKPLPPQPRSSTSSEFAHVLYDFSSEDPEELTVSEGDRVLVLDKSDPEWWQVQLSPPHGRAGLVPSAYVAIQPALSQKSPTPSTFGSAFLPSAVSVVADAAHPLPPPPPPPAQAQAQAPPAGLHGFDDMPPLPARTESVRKAASDAHSAEQTKNTLPSLLPPPQTAVYAAENGTSSPVRRNRTTDSDNVPLHVLQKRQSDTNTVTIPSASSAMPGPDMSKVRTWTDGSGAYTVDAQFLSLDSQNNVNLHKTNGKKINVPLSKFAQVDRDYVYNVAGNAPAQPPPMAQTARQRQLESARKTPGKRIINYDWDWFDFFTLKAGISADNSLKYATSFVAERLDDQSIPEIGAALMQQLGVKQSDIPNIERAFRAHCGLPEETTGSQLDNLFASPAPAQRQEMHGPSRLIAPDRPAVGVPAVSLIEASIEQPRLPPRSPTSADAPASPGQPKIDSNPWGMDSNLDRRVGRRKQIEDDEAFARRLQQEEKDNSKRDRKHHFWNRNNNESNNAKPDPFTSLDGTPGGSSSGSHQRTGSSAKTAPKQPLNLASGTRKVNKSQVSFVDPTQLRSAQQKLSGQTSPRIASPLLDTSVSSGRGAAAIDQAFNVNSGSPGSPGFRQTNEQQQQPSYDPPPRARPPARQPQQSSMANIASHPIPASPQSSSIPGFGELTTNRMAAATASGNTAQIDQLERMAKAREQELAAQEARIKHQQEEIRKQAMFLQQQQQHLLQMQQSQKVEAQLKQLKEEKERLEQQRQAEELKRQVELLRSQQQQMLKMQQMATQARGAMAAGGNPSQPQIPQLNQQMPQAMASLSNMATGPTRNQQQAQLALQQQQQQQQQQQKAAPLSSRLPPPLVPSRVNKPMTPQPNQLAFQNQQQQQLGGGANVFSTNGLFGVSQGIANVPAPSTLSAGLAGSNTVAARGMFLNHAVTGSTPNLGSFANPNSIMGTTAGIGNAGGIGSGYNGNSNIAATHSVTNFGTFNNNQQMNQFAQQKQLMMSNNGQTQQFNAGANKYDIFKSVNPHGPSVFTGDLQQQQQQQNQMLGGMNTQLMSTNASGNIMPAGFVMNNQQQSSGPRPTGIFAMANPTLSQPQQQQIGLQHNVFQNQMFSAQQSQPQQPQQQQQAFGVNQPGSVNGIGGQIQWR